jgi:hypothetical protein
MAFRFESSRLRRSADVRPYHSPTSNIVQHCAFRLNQFPQSSSTPRIRPGKLWIGHAHEVLPRVTPSVPSAEMQTASGTSPSPPKTIVCNRRHGNLIPLSHQLHLRPWKLQTGSTLLWKIAAPPAFESRLVPPAAPAVSAQSLSTLWQ